MSKLFQQSLQDLFKKQEQLVDAAIEKALLSETLDGLDATQQLIYDLVHDYQIPYIMPTIQGAVNKPDIGGSAEEETLIYSFLYKGESQWFEFKPEQMPVSHISDGEVTYSAEHIKIEGTQDSNINNEILMNIENWIRLDIDKINKVLAQIAYEVNIWNTDLNSIIADKITKKKGV